MKKLFTFATLSMLFVLAGCASIETSVTCTDNTRVLLNAENDRLVARKAEIEAMEANPQKIGGMVYSSLSNADMIAQYKRGYNSAYDLWKYHSDNYNRLCTK